MVTRPEEIVLVEVCVIMGQENVSALVVSLAYDVNIKFLTVVDARERKARVYV